MDNVYQYYITEVIKTQAGEYEHYNYWVFDEDDEKARLKGESKYHEILASAAISTHKTHGCILFSSRCNPISHQFYEHSESVSQEA